MPNLSEDMISWSQAENWIETIRPRIIAGLLPDVDTKRYLAILTEYIYRNPALLRCDLASLEKAVIDAALLGLELGPPFDLATIVYYRDKKSNGPPVASLLVEYRGHMVQVYRTGRVRSIEARPVYAKDSFDYRFGRQPVLTHRPAAEADRGQLVFAYAIAELAGGCTAMEVINAHDAARALADSPGADKPGSLWKTRTAEMWTKTAIKKLINRMPRAPAASPRARGDPPPQFAELLHAVSISPELYQVALNDLDLPTPFDDGSIAATLARMRTLYRSKKQTDTHKDQPQ
jgi:phage RecT family recombinase